MAMNIGGEYRPDYVQPRHLDELLEQAGLGPAARAVASERSQGKVHQPPTGSRLPHRGRLVRARPWRIVATVRSAHRGCFGLPLPHQPACAQARTGPGVRHRAAAFYARATAPATS